MRVSLRALLPAATATILLIALHWPGSATYDSYQWLTQARSGILTDIQPPGAPLLLMVLDRILPGFMLFIAINIGLVVFSTNSVLEHTVQDKHLRIVMLFACLMAPPIVGNLGVAWRDVTGLGLTVASLAFALAANQTDSRPVALRYFGICIFLTFIGCMFRYNHVAGAAAILALSAWPVFRNVAHPVWRAVAATGLAILACVTTTVGAWSLINKFVEKRVYFEQVGIHYMLARVSVLVGENLFPSDTYPKVTLERLEALVSDPRGYPYKLMAQEFERRRTFNENIESIFPVFNRDNEIDRLVNLENIARMKYPQAWLRVYAEDALVVSSFTNRNGHRTVVLGHNQIQNQLSPEEINFQITRPQSSKSLLRHIQNFNTYPILNNASLFLLLASALYALCLLLIAQKQSITVAASTICMLAALGHYTSIVLFGRLYDFRWFHETYFFCFLGLLLSFSILLREQFSRQGPDDVSAASESAELR